MLFAYKINHRHTCATKVTYLVFVSACLSVCLSIYVSPWDLVLQASQCIFICLDSPLPVHMHIIVPSVCTLMLKVGSIIYICHAHSLLICCLITG